MLFLGLKYLGCGVPLCYLGVAHAARCLAAVALHPEAARGARRTRGRLPAVSQGAAAEPLSNPKAILFFISFFIQFVDPAYAHPGLSFLALGAVLELISALYLSFLIFTGVRLAAWFVGGNGWPPAPLRASAPCSSALV
ncbi:Leucine efflux protein LeuE OS=Stutzerimonas stutzeri OX=316 GN=CXK95_17955 PE=3 SV=1 [Stutzerimonas stutzeri]